MNRIILPLLCLFIASFSTAQIVNIPDANFKQALLAIHTPDIDTNGDGEIQVSEAAAVNTLDVSFKNIADLTGIQAFVNMVQLNCSHNNLTQLHLNGANSLNYLDCSNNQLSILHRSDFSSALGTFYCNNNPITSIDLSNMPAGLNWVYCTDNPQLSSLNLGNNPSLTYVVATSTALSSINLAGCTGLSNLECSYNNLSTIDLSGCSSLQNFNCSNSPITSIDLSHCPNMSTGNFSCANTPSLTYINMKNGQGGFTAPNLFNCPALTYICANEADVLPLVNYLGQNGFTSVNVNAYCSFNPGGTYNTISGTIRYDENANGCDAADAAMTGMKVKLTSGAQVYYTTVDNYGNYQFFTGAGNFTVTPQLENPYFTLTPASSAVSFAAANNSVSTRNFCVAKAAVHNDLEITMIPQTAAKPGFNASYQLVYTNKGTELVSGAVDLDFDANRLLFLDAFPVADNITTGHLKWNFSNLHPFESRTIQVYVNVLAPPVNNINDTLYYTAAITPVAGDETPANNSFQVQQVIVGSFDPNDKACIEGATIPVARIGDYVHYLVRFQNLGNDTAINIVVKDLLQDKFDWSSFVFTKSSHPCVVRQTAGNQLEFIFQNINLLPKIQNDSASHGFVSFKVKSKTSLVAGDTLRNKADVYFDFNLPVVTNTTVTRYVNIQPVTVNLGADVTVCGGPVLLNAGNPGAHYVWNTGDTTQTLSVNTSGTYWVHVTNNSGNSGADTINVTINPKPVVNLGSDIVQCGGTATLNAGNAGSTYLWSTGAVTSTISVSTTGAYWVRVTNGFGCSAYDTISVTINPLPVVNLGADITQCGGNVTLNAGNAGSTYLWSTGAVTSTINVSATGAYWVRVTNGSGCSAYDTINVTISPLPVVNLGADITQCGGTATLNAGNAGSTYLWSTGAVTSTISVSATGAYWVRVTNGAGCSAYDTINVAINPLPVVNLGADITQCGGTATLNAGNAGSSYLWSTGAVTSTINVSATGAYWVRVTNGSGCSAYDTINVTISPLPVVNLGADITQCGGTATLDAGNSGSTYLWSTGAVTSTINVNATGAYWVRVTNGSGCSAYDTINVTINSLPVVNLGADITQCGGNATLNAGNAGSTYLWSTGAVTSTINVNTAGTYWVRVTNGSGCFAYDTVNVNISTSPVVNLGNDITQCGGNVTLNAGNAGSTYLWSTGAITSTINVNTTGVYVVRVTNNSGCYAYDTIQVTINPIPSVNLGADVNICTGSSWSLDAGNPGSSYLWNDGSTGRTLIVSQAGNYFVRVTNVGGCSSTDTITVTVQALPVISFSLPDTVYANDAPILLSASPAGGQYSGTGVSNGYFDPLLAGMGSHTIQYTYSNAFGCSASASATIFVNAPVANVNVYPNPNHGQFSITVTKALRNSLLTIVTPSGQQIGTYQLSATLQQFRLSLRPGLYYLKFSNKDFRQTTRMLVW